MGPGLQESTWGFSGVVLRMRVDPCNYNDSNSCAFARVFPHGQDREKLKMWAWWLYNVPLQRGVVSYLIPADGDPVEIRKVMAKRGFRTVAVSPSRMANYNAWLLVHPSDPILRQTRTKKVDFDDELLGIAIASCDGIRNARSTDGRSKQARLVSNPVPVNERTA